MRQAGMTEVARGFGPHDHLCWSHEDLDESRYQAVEFLAAGLTQRQRVCYVTSGDADQLVAGLQGIDVLGRTLGQGGVSGLRVAAEATPLVRAPEQLDAFAFRVELPG